MERLMTHSNRIPAGFTLLELVISLVVLGVLIFVATPQLSSFMQERQALAAIRSLDQGFSMARSEAVKRRAIVTICPLSDSSACSFDWNRDIAIFEDANGDRARSPGETLITTINATSYGHFRILVSNRNYFQYGATGRARNTMGSVIFCPVSPPPEDVYLKLVMPLSGRTRIDRVTGNGDCPT